MTTLAWATFRTAQIETTPTAIPANTSRRKWLAVAMTQNQTQAGHRAQRAFVHRRRQSETR